jgi:hypothetical protein
MTFLKRLYDLDVANLTSTSSSSPTGSANLPIVVLDQPENFLLPLNNNDVNVFPRLEVNKYYIVKYKDAVNNYNEQNKTNYNKPILATPENPEDGDTIVIKLEDDASPYYIGKTSYLQVSKFSGTYTFETEPDDIIDMFRKETLTLKFSASEDQWKVSRVYEEENSIVNFSFYESWVAKGSTSLTSSTMYDVVPNTTYLLDTNTNGENITSMRLTLPTSEFGFGSIYGFKKGDTIAFKLDEMNVPVAIYAASDYNFEGGATFYALDKPYQFVKFAFNGIEWVVIDSNYKEKLQQEGLLQNKSDSFDAEIGMYYSISTENSTGNIAVTMPLASNNERVTFKINDAVLKNSVIIAGGSILDTIEGDATLTLNEPHQSVTLVYNSEKTNWEII